MPGRARYISDVTIVFTQLSEYHMKPPFLHAYAIVRFETDRDPSVPIEHRITVKKIVFDPHYAEEEVQRLNELNRDKGAFYFSQITRIQGVSAVADAVLTTADAIEHADVVKQS